MRTSRAEAAFGAVLGLIDVSGVVLVFVTVFVHAAVPVLVAGLVLVTGLVLPTGLVLLTMLVLQSGSPLFKARVGPRGGVSDSALEVIDVMEDEAVPRGMMAASSGRGVRKGDLRLT